MTPLQKARALGAYIEECMREVHAVTAAQAQQS
jgi:type II secretory pathway component PulM